MGIFEEDYTRLNSEQKRAVDAIDGPLLVIAGPGTGKTQLLTTRVANILRISDAQPQNILCLTFTESAAHEMRERLINIVGQSAYNITISTYHAFGSELIRRFPDYFNNSPDMQAIDNLGIYSLVQDIIASLPYSNALKKSDYYIKDVVSVISDFKQALFAPKEIRQIARANIKFIDACNKLTKHELGGIARINKQSIPAFVSLLAACQKLDKSQFVIPGVVSLGSLWTEQLAEAVSLAEQSGKTSSITAWKNSWLAKDIDGEFVVAGLQTNQKLLALADIYEAYLTELEARQLYDYDDMIGLAIEGLKNNSDLRYSLQEQYMYILLDEFQDTNAAQLKLVKLMTDNPSYEGKPNILAVGDDDQAIYAFQGAKYSHMLGFRDMYKDVTVISLTKNYRSHQDVLHVAHNIAQQIESRLHHHVKEINKVLTAENKDLPAKSHIERHEFKSDVAQYGWVTQQIAELIKNGVAPHEISVLAPQHRYLEPVIPYLRQLNIPVRYDKREDVLEDTHIVQLIRMGELVLALSTGNSAYAHSLWPQVLSYDFWQLPTEHIWQLSWQANDSRSEWSKLLMSDKLAKQIAMFFAQLANLSSIETLETMLDLLVGVIELPAKTNQPAYRSPFYEYYFGREARESAIIPFWSLLSNLTVLRQHLRDHRKQDSGQLSLGDMVTFAQAHQAANIKVLNTSPYNEAADAVQVMTAYKAKGMEFEHVFVLASIDEVWGSRASSQSAKISLPPNLNFVRYEGASDDERLRLLFVAITRAKIGLYLTSYESNFAGRLSTRLQYLNEILQDDKLLSTMLPKHHQLVTRNNSDTPEVSELSAYWQARHTKPQTLASMKSLLQSRLDQYQLSPTHLNSFTDIIYGGPEHFFLTTILRFPKAPSIDGQYGDAVHETLQWMHISQKSSGKLPNQTEVINTFESKLAARRLSDRDSELLLERGRQSLKIFYVQNKHTFSASDHHEFSFKNQGVLVGNAHLNGKIDKLTLDRKTRNMTIVDYKTGKSHDQWAKNDPKLHKYQQQLYFYKLLVEGSYEFGDYNVSDAYLEFVEPDSSGKIVDLHTTFDTLQSQKLKKLITAIWEHIMDLNFPDISTYPKSIKGILEFEQDLIDGKI